MTEGKNQGNRSGDIHVYLLFAGTGQEEPQRTLTKTNEPFQNAHERDDVHWRQRRRVRGPK
jgi:hypothetical protein